MRRFRRRRILVDSFQSRLLAISLTYFGVVLLTFAGALFIPLVLQLESNSTSWDQKMVASSQFLALHSRLWPAMAVLFVLVAIHIVIVSHRVAGPLYQFRKAFRAVAEGDVRRRVAIRKNDYLTKEMAAINEMLSSIERHIEASRASSERAMAALEGIRRASSEGELAEVNRLTGHLEVHLSQTIQSLDFFRRSSDDETVPAVDGLPVGETTTSIST